MKRLAKELSEFLSGSAGLNQLEFAARCGLDKSKLSRLLAGATSCDAAALDALLLGIPSGDTRTRLVSAYIQDLASAAALAHLVGEDGEPWAGLELGRLSPRGEKALKFLLAHDGIADIEKVFINLAAALAKK